MTAARRHTRYQHDLALLGVDDAHSLPGSRRSVGGRGSGCSSLGRAVDATVLVGGLGNWLPYRAVGRLARIPRTEGMRATFKLLGAVVMFPLWWLGSACWPGQRCLVAGPRRRVPRPACGYAAVRGLERWRAFGGRLEARAIVAARRDVMGAVLADRGEIFEAALALPLDSQQALPIRRHEHAPPPGRLVPDPGDVAQLVEHLPCTQGVEGSSPFVSTE